MTSFLFLDNSDVHLSVVHSNDGLVWSDSEVKLHSNHSTSHAIVPVGADNSVFTYMPLDKSPSVVLLLNDRIEEQAKVC